MAPRSVVVALLAAVPVGFAVLGGLTAAAQVPTPERTGEAPAAVAAEVTEAATASVGKVTSSGWGSGWIAAPDTVITNLHVARTTETYFTPAATGRPIRCYRAAAIRDGDVAALKCPTGSLPVLPRREEPARRGEAVAMIGYPGGRGPTVTHGEVTTTDQEIRGISTVGVTAPGEPGSSGSPIIDAEGRVIAVATFGGAGPAINGFHVVEVQRLLDDGGYLPATQTAAEWRLRAIRSAAVAVLAGGLGAFLQWRSGYPGVGRRAARYAAVAVALALAGTQLQLWIDGPVHFV